MRVKVLTDANWLLKKGEVREVREVHNDVPYPYIVLDHGLYPIVGPVLFPGEYEEVSLGGQPLG